MTKKITENELRNLIRESIKKTLNEYTGSYKNGTVTYISPSGKFNLRGTTPLNKRGKANNNNFRSTDGTLLTTNISANEYSHGKGHEIFKILIALDDLLKGKIEWTDDEKESIKDIKIELYRLAQRTKENGNEKRGYNGPKKDGNKEKA